MRMGHVETILFLIATFCRSRCQAFEVSIHQFNRLPVVGIDFTIGCTFTPRTWSRTVAWEKAGGIVLATHSCTDSYHRCESAIGDETKYRVEGDDYGVNLTIHDIIMTDGDGYECTVRRFRGSTQSRTLQLSPVLAAPPQWILIRDDNSNAYGSNAPVTVWAGKHYNMTCLSGGARPPAFLAWEFPGDIIADVRMQSDTIKDDSYISRKVATITPSIGDQGKVIQCVASHSELVYHNEPSIYLNVQGCQTLEVSIHRFNRLPIVGTDFTLGCSFTPQTWSRTLMWEKGEGFALASDSCTYSHHTCESVIEDKSKYSLTRNDGSVNITIHNVSMVDEDDYKCRVSGSSVPVWSRTFRLVPQLPAPLQWLLIHDVRSPGYRNNASITVTAGEQYEITCESGGARPPVVLTWVLPGDIAFYVGEQSDEIQGNSYISWKNVRITPTSNEQAKSLHCLASHPEIAHDKQRSVFLSVRVHPSSALLSSANQTTNGYSPSTVFYVYENASTLFTCKSIGSLPAIDLLWALGTTYGIQGNTSISVLNSLDENLFDSESNLTIFIERKHHGKFLQCLASSEIFFDVRIAKMMVFGYHAFYVSVQTFRHLPVIGENFTLICNFTPKTWYRTVTWEKVNVNVLTIHSCTSNSSCNSVNWNERKFILSGDDSGANLTIHGITTDDDGVYRCRVMSSSGSTWARSLHLSSVLPAPPQRLSIQDDRSSAYFDNARVAVTAGVQYAFTCESSGARPPVVLAWKIPGDVTARVGSQSNVVQSGSYSSRRVATIMPSSDDEGKTLRCVASHPQLNLQRSVSLGVQVPPSSLLLSSADQISNRSLPTVFNVYENSSTSFTCKSTGSLHAVEFSWTLGTAYRIADNTSITVSNTLDGSLFDSESNLTILIEIKHHGKFLQCYAYASSESFLEIRTALLRVYGDFSTFSKVC